MASTPHPVNAKKRTHESEAEDPNKRPKLVKPTIHWTTDNAHLTKAERALVPHFVMPPMNADTQQQWKEHRCGEVVEEIWKVVNGVKCEHEHYKFMLTEHPGVDADSAIYFFQTWKDDMKALQQLATLLRTFADEIDAMPPKPDVPHEPVSTTGYFLLPPRDEPSVN